MGRIPQLVQQMPAPVGIRPRGSGVPWYRAGGAPAPVAAYQPKGAASLAASYINLANPGTNDAAPGVAPTFAAATGWTFNGTTQFLTTGIIYGVNTGWSMIVQYTGGATLANEYLCGADNGADTWLLLCPRLDVVAANSVCYGNGTTFPGALPTVVPLLAAGNLCVAGQQGYRNGAPEGAAINAKTNAIAIATYVGGENSGGTMLPSAATIQAWALYSATLTAGQVAAVAAAMAAL